MHVFKAGVLYFALVFAAGFVLGTVRTLWVVPHVGVRTAKLLEAHSAEMQAADGSAPTLNIILKRRFPPAS
jgi:hypothetical protein